LATPGATLAAIGSCCIGCALAVGLGHWLVSPFGDCCMPPVRHLRACRAGHFDPVPMVTLVHESYVSGLLRTAGEWGERLRVLLSRVREGGPTGPVFVCCGVVIQKIYSLNYCRDF